MWKWLRRWAGKPEPAGEDPEGREKLVLEREVQGLRLELESRDQMVADLKRELERARKDESARVTGAVQAQMERLLTDAAAPVAQLFTQAYLLEAEGKPVQAKDVLAVARRMVRVLEDNGLTLEGHVGETMSFDPNRHEPLSAEAAPKPGEAVTVRFVGVSYSGKVIRKAGVVVRGRPEES